MAKVHVLPDHIASQIAAGEVVERPSSVVKELVENSLDAGATQIEIVIGSECRDIRVADNGQGMDPEDAVLAFSRHATSKLAAADDLFKLNTMGFRGEALPSISSVAKVTCLTKTPNSQVGTKLAIQDGKINACETGCASGTVIEVCDLFYNVPARLKFLKRPSTEFAHILETVQALSIAYPDVAFQLINDDEDVLQTSGSGKLSKAIVETGFWSDKIELRPVTEKQLPFGMSIQGFLASPTHFRGDRKGILTIVNNRPVRCPLTYKSLEYAYSDLIPRGRHPFAVIAITLAPEEIDVNVHPTKKEIKYSHSSEVYLAIQRALTAAARLPADDALGTTFNTTVPAERSLEVPPIPEPRRYEGVFASSLRSAPPNPGLVREAIANQIEQITFVDHLDYTPTRSPGALSQPETPSQSQQHEFAKLPAGWRLLGYLHNTYFLMETPDGLEIIEQHIAHERTLYEKILKAQETPGRIAESSQVLVVPLALALSPEQTSCLADNIDALKSLGFDFVIDSQGSVLLKQIPVELSGKEQASAVQKMIEDLTTTDKANFSLEASKSLACQSAIKNGMLLSHQDIIELIAAWIKTPRNDTCPHGRPVRLKFSMEKLFQLFHPA